MRKSSSQIKVLEPDRVVIAKPRPWKYRTLRGPVKIYFLGKFVGIGEIDHDPEDPNRCSTLLSIYKRKFLFFKFISEFVFFRYSLKDVENLQPEDIPYLIHIGDGKYRHPNEAEMRALYNL